MIRTYTVYALVDPREPDVYRYIGLTHSDPRVRLGTHYGDLGCVLNGGGKLSKKHEWLHKMRSDGFLALVIPLEETSDLGKATAAELRWIEQYLPSGMLTNGIPSTPYFEPTHRRCRFCEQVRPVEDFLNKRCSACETYRIEQERLEKEAA